MPALEGGQGPRHRGTVGPILAVPRVVLGPADKIQQLAARHEIMHEVRAGPDPGLAAELEVEIEEALDRHQPAIGDAAGKSWRLFAEQVGAHCRMDAVGADQDVGRDALAVVEPGLDMVALTGKADEAIAEMDALGRQPRGNHRQQIGAMDRHIAARRRAARIAD
jgi:hypothetical protein